MGGVTKVGRSLCLHLPLRHFKNFENFRVQNPIPNFCSLAPQTLPVSPLVSAAAHMLNSSWCSKWSCLEPTTSITEKKSEWEISPMIPVSHHRKEQCNGMILSMEDSHLPWAHQSHRISTWRILIGRDSTRSHRAHWRFSRNWPSWDRERMHWRRGLRWLDGWWMEHSRWPDSIILRIGQREMWVWIC